MNIKLKNNSLNYHEFPIPGKISVNSTKEIKNYNDLSLAYSPGVAYASKEILKNPLNISRFTIRNNLVGIISNGSAVLGLGNIGPLAAKPVMEGKAVLFKKFANINAFDIEINESNPKKLIKIITSLEPTFGGINLEDIKSPECFIIENECNKKMNIPVFHDDQHGTAIVVAAAIKNALKISKKDIKEVKLVTSGAGAAAIACLNLLVKFGLQYKNIYITDIAGVVYKGRKELMDPYKEIFAQNTNARNLDSLMNNADIFLGLSVGGVLKTNMIKKMAEKPLILALANPIPEIFPELIIKTRPDAIIATGRSDYNNQVNNVLCFPFIFRGALDVGATIINEKMKIAAVNSISKIAKKKPLDKNISFGNEYIIPKPFDHRLLTEISTSVAKAAIDSGVATKPIKDIKKYKKNLKKLIKNKY